MEVLGMTHIQVLEQAAVELEKARRYALALRLYKMVERLNDLRSNDVVAKFWNEEVSE